MKYIIMADGKGTRWSNYHNIPKHFIPIKGEKLIQRTIRLVNQIDDDADVIVTSHNRHYEFEGARRYEPKNNLMEIDRFTEELIEDNICFLYGDAFYPEQSVIEIIQYPVRELMFFGNVKTIVGIKVMCADVFKKHIKHVKHLYKEKIIKNCKGWQVYQSYASLPIGEEKLIGDSFIDLGESAFDINTPADYRRIFKGQDD